jgi:hypothetical protein
MCRDDVIVALGINGVDELPDMVGEKIIEGGSLHDIWLDPEMAVGPGSKDKENREALADELRKTANETKADLAQNKEFGQHFEYATYLRAKKLAEATGVRTLYAHTMTLDVILRRDADPGSLLRAQLGDMVGKGLVIAALLKRAGKFDHLGERIPAAVKPEAMVALARFARDFEHYENVSDVQERLLTSGYWLDPSPEQYSVAVVPVMWPDPSVEPLMKDVNPTGSGDMTFGAFFLIGGV